MSPDDIDKLVVGRDLDSLVAKHIFELNVLGNVQCINDPESGLLSVCFMDLGEQGPENSLHAGNHPVFLYDRGENKQCYCSFADENEQRIFGHIEACLEVVPFYSTDWSEIPKIIEKLDMNWVFEKDLDGVFVTFIKVGEYPFGSKSIGCQTLPEAVCKAALKVKLNN